MIGNTLRWDTKSLLKLRAVSMISLSHLSKAKADYVVCRKYSTAGSSLGRCHTHNNIIPSRTKKSSQANSQQTSSLKVLIRHEAGFIPC